MLERLVLYIEPIGKHRNRQVTVFDKSRRVMPKAKKPVKKVAKKVPAGYHRMPDGSLMKGKTHKKKGY